MTNEENSNPGLFSGKIAIATNDGIRLTGHLGKCKSFMIYEINGEKITGKELRENVFTHHMQSQNHNHEHHGEGEVHSHEQLINGLRDVSYLISGGGGWRVMEDLKKNNITPIFSDVELIEDAVSKFIKGELKDDAGLVCNHDAKK